MEILQEVWKQRLRPRAVVGYGVKIFLPSPPKYVTRSPGYNSQNLFCPDLPIFVLEGMYRLPKEEAEKLLPQIPVQPIGYKDAYPLLK